MAKRARKQSSSGYSYIGGFRPYRVLGSQRVRSRDYRKGGFKKNHHGSYGPSRLAQIVTYLSRILLLVFVCFALFVAIKSFSRFESKSRIVANPLIAPIIDSFEPPSMLLPEALPNVTTVTRQSAVVHRVKAGQTWAALAGLYGFSLQAAKDVKKAFEHLSKSHGTRAKLIVGQELELIFDSTKGLVKVQSADTLARLIIITKTKDENYVGEIKEFPKKSKERVLLGEITKSTPSFAQTAYKAGVSYELVDELVDLFSDRVRFRSDFHLGDRFTVIYHEEILDDGTVVAPGPILAATLDVSGEHYSAIRYVGNDGEARYFDENGRHLGNAFLRYPVKFTRISSQFSRARFHPVLKRSRPHNGVDFAAAHGTSVRSVADGRVIFAARKGGNGIMVQIQHNERYKTAYLHLSKIAKGVRKGVRVARGQVIGAVGSTGLATGPHLHFSFYDRGKYVDPLKIKLPTVELLKRGQRINPRYLKRVRFTLNRYQRLDLENLYTRSDES